MSNIFDALVNAGLSKEEAEKSIKVVYKWTEKKYPVLAAVARSTIVKESNVSLEEEQQENATYYPEEI